MALTELERNQMADQRTAEQALRAAVDRSVYPLVRRLSDAAGDAGVVAENKVLRIVGMQLAQHGLGDLFEDVYAAVLDGQEVEPGDGLAFLRSEFRDG